MTSLSPFQSPEKVFLSRKVTTEHPILALVIFPLNSNCSMDLFCLDGTDSICGSTILHCSHIYFSDTRKIISWQVWG